MPMPEIDFGAMLGTQQPGIRPEDLNPLPSHNPMERSLTGDRIAPDVLLRLLNQGRSMGSAMSPSMSGQQAVKSFQDSQIGNITDPSQALGRMDELKAELGGLKEPAIGPDQLVMPMASLGRKLPTMVGSGLAKAAMGMTVPQAVGFEAGMALPKIATSDEWQEANPLKAMGLEMTTGLLGAGGAHKLAGMKLPELGTLAQPLMNETGAMTLPTLTSGDSLWEKGVGKWVQKALDRAGEIKVISDKGIGPRMQRALGGDRLVDMFTSAKDRVEAPLGNLMKKTEIESGRLSKSLETTSLALRDMPLEEREQFSLLLKNNFDLSKVDPAYTAKFATILQPYDAAYGVTKTRMLNRAQYEKMYEDDMAKRMKDLFAHNLNDPAYQAQKAITPHDLTTVKGTRDFLDDMITSPMIEDDGLKKMALDLYNLPSKTISEVGQASKQSLTSVLAGRVAANPNWARLKGTGLLLDILAQHPKPNTTDVKLLKAWEAKITKLKGDYVSLPGVKGLEDYLVHKDVAEGFRDLNQMDSVARHTWNAYFLNPWKMSKAILNPAARIRDVLNNMMFADIAGANPLSPFRVDRYAQALKEMKHGGAYAKEFERVAGITHSNWSDINVKEATRAIKHGASMPEMLLSATYNNKLVNTMTKITEYGDQWVKMAKYIHNREAGMAPFEAADDAVKAVGDYTRQNKFTRSVRDTAMPFFGWQMHALRTVGQGLVHHPVRTAKYLTLPYLMQQYAISQLNITQDDWAAFKEKLPEFQQTHVGFIPTKVPMPVRDEKGRLQLMDIGWWLPGLQDVGEMSQQAGNPMALMQNPAVNMFADIARNKTFTGAPIWHEWEEPQIKMAKALAHLGQQIAPAWTPGVGTAFNKAYKSIGEDPMNENLTPAQAAGSFIGYRVKPLDMDKTTANYYKGLKRQVGEAKGRLTHDISRTTDYDKQQELSQEFQDVVKRLYKVD